MAEERSDTEDREDGGVRPNDRMDVARILRVALHGVTP